MLPSEDDAGPPTPDVADGEHEGFAKDWACVSDTETTGCSSGSVLQGINEQLSLHVSEVERARICLLYTSPSPRDGLLSRMPSSA